MDYKIGMFLIVFQFLIGTVLRGSAYKILLSRKQKFQFLIGTVLLERQSEIKI